jgi:hypothetical protein
MGGHRPIHRGSVPAVSSAYKVYLTLSPAGGKSPCSFVRQLRGPHFSTWAWCSSRALDIAVLAQSWDSQARNLAHGRGVTWTAASGDECASVGYELQTGDGAMWLRLHYTVRGDIGLPAGRVFRKVGGTGDLPDVVWQLEYPDQKALGP